MSNVEFSQSIHFLTHLVASQNKRVTFITPSSQDIRVRQFIRFSLFVFSSSKVEKDPQYFINKMEKIFRVMHATNMEFSVY